jgi:hypothetical protein
VVWALWMSVKSFPCQELNPGCLAHSPFLYQLTYPDSLNYKQSVGGGSSESYGRYAKAAVSFSQPPPCVYVILLYSAFNRGGNREMSVQPEQHVSRIAGVTADSGMSQQR